MVRLYLFAEGRSEQTFANTVLTPHLACRKVYLYKPVLIANARKKQRTNRGGGGNFHAMQNDINRFLKQHSGRDAFFTSMIDLYALHKEFPGVEEAQKFAQNPYKRVRVLEKSWAQKTGDPRFIPHIQLHEYEAYLFADISILSNFYPEEKHAIDQLQENSKLFETPELIDDGQDTAPSKRISKQIARYGSDKATVGVQAASRIGLAKIGCKCPHFSEWLTKLECLGAQSGA